MLATALIMRTSQVRQRVQGLQGQVGALSCNGRCSLAPCCKLWARGLTKPSICTPVIRWFFWDSLVMLRKLLNVAVAVFVAKVGGPGHYAQGPHVRQRAAHC